MNRLTGGFLFFESNHLPSFAFPIHLSPYPFFMTGVVGSYPYEQVFTSRYSFVSIGKRNIEKVVEFTPTGIRNIMNLGFGDLLPDGSIDDTVHSNNGDIIKVLSTVVRIITDYTSHFPSIEILFTGSTDERTRLYTRILRTYYDVFNKQFTIKGIIRDDDTYAEIPFSPNTLESPTAFLISKKFINFK